VPAGEGIAKLLETVAASAPGGLLAAVALAAWWYERRTVAVLQGKLYRLAVTGLSRERER